MKRTIAVSALMALVFSAAAVLTVSAQDQTEHYNIAIFNALTHDYPVTGTMDLTYHANGIVRGYYHPAGLPSFVPITGGRTGNSIWLSIGTQGKWTLNGRVNDNGKITGSATGHGDFPYSFVATPM